MSTPNSRKTSKKECAKKRFLKVYGNHVDETTPSKWVKWLEENSIRDIETGCCILKDSVKAYRKGAADRQVIYPHRWLKIRGKEQIAFPLPCVLAVFFKLDVGHRVASHLCHNGDCVNPEHVVFEFQHRNAERTHCSADRCHHTPRCLQNGAKATNGDVAYVFNSATGKLDAVVQH